MFPGLGNMDPRKMKMMMRQFGIKSEDLSAKRVIFELENSKLVIENPQVTVMDIGGQKTYTVVGAAKETEEDSIPESDVKMVAEQANVSQEKAKAALKESNGDIAQAISKFKE